MRIKWEIDDGYGGKSRPHFLTIDDADFEDMTPEEINTEIDEAVQNEFETKISPYWKIVE